MSQIPFLISSSKNQTFSEVIILKCCLYHIKIHSETFFLHIVEKFNEFLTYTDNFISYIYIYIYIYIYMVLPICHSIKWMQDFSLRGHIDPSYFLNYSEGSFHESLYRSCHSLHPRILKCVMCHNWCNHPFPDGHTSCFPFVAIINRTDINIINYKLLRKCRYFLIGKT